MIYQSGKYMNLSNFDFLFKVSYHESFWNNPTDQKIHSGGAIKDYNE